MQLMKVAPEPHATILPQSKTYEQCAVAGFGWDGYQCSRCSRGQFSTGNSRQPCSQCPSGTTSIEGSTSAAACVCLPGSGGNCTVCPPGELAVSSSSWQYCAISSTVACRWHAHTVSWQLQVCSTICGLMQQQLAMCMSLQLLLQWSAA